MIEAIEHLHAQAEAEARSTLKAIRVFAELTADYMERAHGGDWQIQIDHEVGLVAVTRRFVGRQANNGRAS